MSKYNEKCYITNIHYNKIRYAKGDRTLYACLYDENDELLISATLDYIIEELSIRIDPPNEQRQDI